MFMNNNNFKYQRQFQLNNNIQKNIYTCYKKYTFNISSGDIITFKKLILNNNKVSYSLYKGIVIKVTKKNNLLRLMLLPLGTKYTDSSIILYFNNPTLQNFKIIGKVKKSSSKLYYLSSSLSTLNKQFIIK